MFIYIYYAKGRGCHKSHDDVAIIRAWSKKQALKLLKKYVNLQNLKNYEFYRLKWYQKYYNKHVRWISDY